jgi:glucans biosynthesis protein
MRFGTAAPFSFEALKARAEAASRQPYRPPEIRASDVLQKLDYDAIGKVRFRPEMTLWSDRQFGPGIRFFHLHRWSKNPVRISLVEKGAAREILYSPDYFEKPAGNPAEGLPRDIGFGGFRVLSDDAKGDWLAYQGASYFRSAGPLDQYGLSARGIAIDTATMRPEEFPRFSEFWLELDQDRGLTIFALLDGPSLTGAFRIMTSRKDDAVVQEIQSALFMRKPVERLGVAPLTSMFWYGENTPRGLRDWRPEIHDSDGLALLTGTGERIWRPLNNPPRVMANAFADENPRGFGLLQRDRNFSNYQDDGVFYDRRPSLWVEPLGFWGKGSVQLVEIPTDDEVHDNVVAFWVPAGPTKVGQRFDFAYRLHWLAREPFPAPVARICATRLGLGGVPGAPHPANTFKIVLDLEGEKFAGLSRESGVSAVVSASRGTVSATAVYPVVGTDLWRLMFDIAASGEEPIDLRTYVRLGNEPLSETWLYQLFPSEIGQKSGA